MAQSSEDTPPNQLKKSMAMAHLHTCARLQENLKLINELIFPTITYNFSSFTWQRPIASNSITDVTPREKRQVIIGAAIGIGALVGIVTSYVAPMFTSSHTGDLAAGATEDVIHEMEGLEGKAATSADRVRMLRGAVDNLTAILNSEADELEILAHSLFTQNQQMIILEEQEQIIQGLSALVTGRLSPALVSPLSLDKGLQSLQLRLNISNSAFLPESRNDLYRLDASYLAMSNRTIFLMLHIPFCQPEDMMRAFRYIPSPLQLTPHHYLIPRPQQEVILATDDMSRVRLMNYVEFQDCNLINQAYYCAYSNYYSSSSSSCIYYLYTNNATGISNTCPITTAPAEDYLVQLGLVEFLIYHKEEAELILYCGSRRVDTAKFSGLRRISLPPGCKGYSSKVAFFGSYSLTFAPYAVRYHDLNLTASFPDFNHAEKEELTELVNSLDKITSVNGPVDGIRLTALRSAVADAQVARHYQKAIWIMGTVITTAAVIGCVYWKYRPRVPNIRGLFPFPGMGFAPAVIPPAPPPSRPTHETREEHEMEPLHRSGSSRISRPRERVIGETGDDVSLPGGVEA